MLHFRSHRWMVFLVAVAVLLLAASSARAMPIVNQIVGAESVAQYFPNIDGVNDFTGEVQRVAILDTGIQADHPGLNGRVVGGINLASGFEYESTDPAHYTDMKGHGTFVAGVIGSSLAGVPGIAPKVEFVSVRVLNASGNGDFYEVANGLEWVVANAEALNITAVNLSLGSSSTYAYDEQVPDWYTMNRMRNAFDQLAEMDIVSVVASGNGGSTEGLSVPAVFDNTVSVGASTKTDTMWSSTNRNDTLELLAPGASIDSLWLNDGLATGSGTSYAAPVVTASAVLMREFIDLYDVTISSDYDHFQDRFVNILQQTGESIYDPASGLTYQRIDMEAAFSLLASQLGVDKMVPEPASLLLFCTGLLLVGQRRRRAA